MRRTKRLSGAFTLIELLVVISILAILAAVIVPKIGDAKNKALRVSCATNMKGIVRAMKLYTMDYPASTCPPGANSLEVFGAMYYTPSGEKDAGGLTSMGIYVCPAAKNQDHEEPTHGAYGAALTADGSATFVDYAIVLKSGASVVLPDVRTDPDDNAVLIERSGTNHAGGRNVSFLSSNVKFLTNTEVAALRNTGTTGEANVDFVSAGNWFLTTSAATGWNSGDIAH